MSTSQATVDLVFRARNLADAAVADLTGSIAKVGQAGAAAAGRFAGAFRGMGDKLANGIGNATETLASGGSVPAAMAGLGIYMAGQLAEQFGGQLIERLAGSSLIAAITAPLAAVGTAIGAAISAAIPIGMALLPVILIGALVAAVAVLIVNPEIRGKVIDFVGGLVGHIGDALRSGLGILLDIVPKAFGAAWQAVVDGVKAYIGLVTTIWIDIPKALIGLGGDILRTIVNGLAGFPSAIANIIGDAFRNLRIDIGPFHISSSGVRVDLPEINVPGFAGGVRNFGGGLAMVGEDGPELVRLPRGADVITNRQTRSSSESGGGGGIQLVGIAQRDLDHIIDERLFVQLKRAGTGG